MKTAAEYSQIKKHVLTILRWSDDQLSNYMYECGLDYLKFYLPHESQYMIHCISSSRIFWNWWKLHWQYRDAAFAEQIYQLMRLDYASEIYADLHDPKTLALSIYPNGMVLEESYNKMIGELNKQAVLQ